MEVLIIEDEIKTAKALAKLITAADPDARIAGSLQRVESAVKFLGAAPPPDLIFMDVQLADGLCFEIFKRIDVAVPVIFCTAFNEYTMEAFKANGVDYILKPFSPDTIKEALEKVRRLQNFFQRPGRDVAGLSRLIEQLQPRTFKQSFLVFSQQKYQTIPTETAAYFHIRNETTMLVNMEGKEYPLTQPLEEVQAQLDPQEFFRLNRQYLVAFRAIKAVEHYFARKLSVQLKVPVAEKMLVGKDKASVFLNWLAER